MTSTLLMLLHLSPAVACASTILLQCWLLCSPQPTIAFATITSIQSNTMLLFHDHCHCHFSVVVCICHCFLSLLLLLLFVIVVDWYTLLLTAAFTVHWLHDAIATTIDNLAAWCTFAAAPLVTCCILVACCFVIVVTVCPCFHCCSTICNAKFYGSPSRGLLVRTNNSLGHLA